MKLKMKLTVDAEEFQAIKEERKWLVRLPRQVLMAALPKNCENPEFREVAFRARWTDDDFSLVRTITKVNLDRTGAIGDYFGPIAVIHFTKLER